MRHGRLTAAGGRGRKEADLLPEISGLWAMCSVAGVRKEECAASRADARGGQQVQIQKIKGRVNLL